MGGDVPANFPLQKKFSSEPQEIPAPLCEWTRDLLGKKWDVVDISRARYRLQIGVDVCHILVGHNLRCVRRHIAGWLANIIHDRVRGNRVWRNSWPVAVPTLSQHPVALVTAIAHEQ